MEYVYYVYTLCFLFIILTAAQGDPDGTPKADTSSKLEFQPSRTRCCKVGEAFAKKKLACTFGEKFDVEHSNETSWNKLRFVDASLDSQIGTAGLMSSSFIRDIMIHSDKCHETQLVSYTNKCCHYRQDYYRQLKYCKSYTDLKKRKACQRTIKLHYP